MTMARTPNLMLRLREALAASWDRRTAYLGVEQAGNAALGQCYPTSIVLQHFYPETGIIKGTVDTGKTIEIHFWNGIRAGNDLYHIDLTWQQFPKGSIVQEFSFIDRQDLKDGEATQQRCALLLIRVNEYLLMSRNRP